MRTPRGVLNGVGRICIKVSLVATVVLFFGWHLSGSTDDHGGAPGQRTPTSPLSPQEALATFELEPGYRIEVAAAEPLVVDPVAMAFDEWGRMYVVESRGYPDPVDPAEELPREGVIALLEDTNGDGRYDKRSDFVERLTFPNGIMVWDGGVFVSCAPDLFYFKDTTGDGRADIRKVVLTGFGTTRTSATRFSHPTLGIDNWVYLTSGLNGGTVTAPAHPKRPPVEFARSDSRFNPFTFEFELTGGQGQYGLTFDDFGRRFICENRHPVWHVMMEPRYLRRNPHLAFSESVHEASTVGPEATVWPLSADRTTASFLPDLLSEPHAGTYTAASGVHIHRGDALPEGHKGSIFICESAQNLVQRQVRHPDGATFVSRPARQGVEFLASRDSWFSPVFAANGPDGALYIVDMYRSFIDHPRFIPEAGRAQLDFEAGKGYGRIYRIVAADWKRERKPFDLTQASAEELAQTLEHPNAWWRETAQRLLVERRDRAALPHLHRLVRHGSSAAARVHALWTLDGLDGLENTDLMRALEDEHAGVRENAVRLAERRLAESPELLARFLLLADDGDARVRFRVALALGETEDPRATVALADVARRDGDRRWARVAVLSAIGNRASAFLKAFTESAPASPEITAAVMQDLGQIFGAGESPEQCVDLILHITDPANAFAWQPAALAGIAEGLRSRELGRVNRSSLTALVSGGTPKAREAQARLESVLQRAAAIAPDERQPVELRLAAIDLLGYSAYSSTSEILEGLLEPQHPSEIQVAAVRSLGRLDDSAGALTLVEPGRWRTYTPQVRAAVLSVVMAETHHLPALLGAIERGDITPTALGPLRRNQLLKHPDAAIQERATKAFANMGSGDRMQVYQAYREKIAELTGQAGPGEKVFATRCGACHTFGDTGGSLAPDLSGIGNQPTEAILLHTLVPDYEITPGYDAYVVEAQDGRTLLGLLESETEASITLRDPSDRRETVPRSNIVSMMASEHSLMPSGLEQLMTAQDLVDLIAFLKEGATGSEVHD